MSYLFCKSYHYHCSIVKCCRNVDFDLKKLILSTQQEKIMDFEYCEEYLRSSIKENSIKESSIKENKFSFSSHLYIDKINQ